VTSIRNNPAASTPEDPLLDAARECILAVGWRRTTLTEVARRAGVSRMTLYRRWPDMQTLLSDLMTREWAAVALTEAQDAAPQSTGAARLGVEVAAMVGTLRRNPLFRKIVAVDAELLLPYLLDRRGRSQDAILALLEDAIAAGQADGSIRPGEPRLLARSVLLATHGMAISADTMVDDEVAHDALLDELRVLVERYVSP
jgi:AcrR family transcriptional regulator